MIQNTTVALQRIFRRQKVLCGGGHTLLATEYTPCRGLGLRILQTFCGAPGSGRDGSLAVEVLGGDIRLPPQRKHAAPQPFEHDRAQPGAVRFRRRF